MINVKKNVQARLSSSIQRNGFVEQRIIDTDGNECSVYSRNIVEVLKEQIRYVLRSDIYTSVSEAVKDLKENREDIAVHSHPIAASLGRIGIEQIRSAVQSSHDHRHIWHDNTSTTPSFAGFVQFHSDKSHSTLKALSFTF